MNASGPAVAAWLAWLKLAPADLLVLVDDFALPLGEVRLRERGSHGGHNGLRSLQQALGTQEYARLRIGIGPVPEKWEVEDFVWPASPRKRSRGLEAGLDRAAAAFQCCQREGISLAMTSFNGNSQDQTQTRTQLEYSQNKDRQESLRRTLHFWTCRTRAARTTRSRTPSTVIEKEINTLGGHVHGTQKMDRARFERIADDVDSGFYVNVQFSLEGDKLAPLQAKLKLGKASSASSTSRPSPKSPPPKRPALPPPDQLLPLWPTS